MHMGRGRADIDHDAPIHSVTREEYQAYFDSLPADERWTNSRYPHQSMIWHWEERRWWALEEIS
jgi:hypothetical protein